jgi:polyphosphate kinase
MEEHVVSAGDSPPAIAGAVPKGRGDNAAYAFADRELSWLSFNGRVLQEAMDTSVPLFERLSFLSIYSSNLDEFFRVRVASLRRLTRLKKKKIRKLSVNPAHLLREIHRTVHEQQEAFGACFRGSVLPDLERAGIQLITESAVTPEQGNYLRMFFRDHVRPLLTPVVLDADAAPHLADRTIHLVVELWPDESIDVTADEPRYGLVQVPSPPLSRFVSLPASGERQQVLFLDDVVRFNLADVFAGCTVGRAYAVKLSRDAELDFEDEFSGDIAAAMRQSLKKRDTGLPSRFLYDMQASYSLISHLKEHFGLANEDLVLGGRYHNLHDLRDFPRVGKDELSYPDWPPLPHPELDNAPSILAAVAERDRVLHFPYQSFEYVISFLTEAARDPDVEEMYLTVYRVSSDSRVLGALVDAAERGKKVRVFVEVQARFDEAVNLDWAERMQRAGVIIMYSRPGIKVHAKLALVVRRERGERRRYGYLGTGNFNERTALRYTDTGLLTSDARVTADVETVFRYLAGEEDAPVFHHLLVAPLDLRNTLYQLIDAEIAAAAQGRRSGITLKVNALEDHDIIGRLYDASRAGVPIRLVVRGICCMMAGVEGLSPTVEIRSIVDRYLEHSRVYVFHNGGSEKIFIASADWMTRNLSHRVEVAVPLYDPDVRWQVRALLDLHLADDTRARIIDPRGTNRYVPAGPGEPVRAQQAARDFLSRLVEDRR